MVVKCLRCVAFVDKKDFVKVRVSRTKFVRQHFEMHGIPVSPLNFYPARLMFARQVSF